MREVRLETTRTVNGPILVTREETGPEPSTPEFALAPEVTFEPSADLRQQVPYLERGRERNFAPGAGGHSAVRHARVGARVTCHVDPPRLPPSL